MLYFMSCLKNTYTDLLSVLLNAEGGSKVRQHSVLSKCADDINQMEVVK